MPSTGAILAVVGVAAAITVALRAIPFAILKPLRESRFVSRMAVWMPVGILGILAAATFRTAASGAPLLYTGIAAAVTAAVHLICGRRTILSVAAGTLCFVLLMNFAV
ncbi:MULTISPECIES: AzlD domain-containing protein [unclassified Actinobaculum]|uniref:branched-chain amino acid transporter permease n=1 Tax=unclassified Actinobaculum TaxID=2609299 RepID=UPI000D527A1E|nr:MULTISPECIES: AzlD domain-containing protein [unclassified Actinobaculum]AWE41760.1 branched-chain amino acid transporter AzlD [Actinobaculum sp. 313]RTE50322.1 branched-chain amino acid transporter AzlD [Actinobaculum sp. 352]